MRYMVKGLIDSRSQKSPFVNADRYEISEWGYERQLLCFYVRLEKPDQWSTERQVARFEGYKLDVVVIR
jgi:hypothetical protein